MSSRIAQGSRAPANSRAAKTLRTIREDLRGALALGKALLLGETDDLERIAREESVPARCPQCGCEVLAPKEEVSAMGTSLYPCCIEIEREKRTPVRMPIEVVSVQATKRSTTT